MAISKTPEASLAMVGEWARGLGVELDQEQLACLDRHTRLILKWNRRIRLTGARERDELLLRHTADSLAATGLLPRGGALLDLGSGAGFPGIPMAVARPDLEILLAESVAKRAAFLSRAVEGLDRARVVRARIDGAPEEEGVPAAAFDGVAARAVRLDELLRVAGSYLRSDGLALYWSSGQTVNREWNEIAARCGFVLHGLLAYRLPQGEGFSIVSWARSGG